MLTGPRVQGSDVTELSLTAGGAFKKPGEPPALPLGSPADGGGVGQGYLACAWYQRAKVQTGLILSVPRVHLQGRDSHESLASWKPCPAVGSLTALECWLGPGRILAPPRSKLDLI